MDRTVELLWGLRQPPSRGPKPVLSVDRISGPREVGWTEAAVAVLAGTGLSGAEQLDAVLLGRS
ncbi:hypothetical protein [Actinomadura sp. 6N118]|uniref:hypothetical protein n=1 Tax=Actinomadura sp. 6N118 TaxID=3375151 RepID=UPI003797DDFA